MQTKDLERINELARKARETELTEEEKAEQKLLRHDYAAAFCRDLKQQLDNTVVVEPDGTRHHLSQRED